MLNNLVDLPLCSNSGNSIFSARKWNRKSKKTTHQWYSLPTGYSSLRRITGYRSFRAPRTPAESSKLFFHSISQGRNIVFRRVCLSSSPIIFSRCRLTRRRSKSTVTRSTRLDHRLKMFPTRFSRKLPCQFPFQQLHHLARPPSSILQCNGNFLTPSSRPRAVHSLKLSLLR